MSGHAGDWRRAHLGLFVIELLAAELLAHLEDDRARELLDQIRELRGHRLAGRDRTLRKLAEAFALRLDGRRLALRAGRRRQ